MGALMTNKLTIGKLAAACGLTTDTIRFYEKRGLVLPSDRSEAGYRLFDTGALDRLNFISRAKTAGFTLDDIRQLLVLRDNPEATCMAVNDHARQKLSELDHKIQALVSMRDTLSNLLARCSGAGPLSECPILGSFERASLEGETRCVTPRQEIKP